MKSRVSRVANVRRQSIRLRGSDEIANQDSTQSEWNDVSVEVMVDQVEVVIVAQWSSGPVDFAREVGVRW